MVDAYTVKKKYPTYYTCTLLIFLLNEKYKKYLIFFQKFRSLKAFSLLYKASFWVQSIQTFLHFDLVLSKCEYFPQITMYLILEKSLARFHKIYRTETCLRSVFLRFRKISSDSRQIYHYWLQSVRLLMQLRETYILTQPQTAHKILIRRYRHWYLIIK